MEDADSAGSGSDTSDGTNKEEIKKPVRKKKQSRQPPRNFLKSSQ